MYLSNTFKNGVIQLGSDSVIYEELDEHTLRTGSP